MREKYSDTQDRDDDTLRRAGQTQRGRHTKTHRTERETHSDTQDREGDILRQTGQKQRNTKTGQRERQKQKEANLKTSSKTYRQAAVLYFKIDSRPHKICSEKFDSTHTHSEC